MIRLVSILFLLGLTTVPVTAGENTTFAVTKGVNISHWLSQSDKRGAARSSYFTRDDVAFIASLGFDHIRIPVDEEQMFDANGGKEKEAFDLLHQALKWCAEFRLRAVVDLHILRSHHFNNEVKPLFTESRAQEEFYECWRKLSGELKKYPLSMVAYELMNEPVADDPETWNLIVNRCAEVIRSREPERTLVIGSNRWQGYETVKHLRLPENDPHIIISFHYYNPFLLTHYRASWTDIQDYKGPVHYPGTLIAETDIAGLPQDTGEKYKSWTEQVYDIHKIESDFQEVLRVAKAKGLRVYCGEYGCIAGSPAEDANRWFRDMNTLFNRHGIARAVWDYKGGFGIIRNGQIWWPMVEALTGRRGDASVKSFALHPDNPRYFLFRGQPVLPVTCGEHYGALLNGAFDFDTYFTSLHKDGLNHSRIFMGAYLEPAQAFNIVDNTLAPSSEHYLSPWARSSQPGSAEGGNKFNLNAWNTAFFERLHPLMQKASELDIILELTLFCPMYGDAQWNISPMNSRNNINGIGNVSREKVYTPDGEKTLLKVQEKLVRKIVETVNGYDNFYFEICNEPYFGGVTMEWQRRITDVIVSAEQSLPKQHLISVNVANGSEKVIDPHPAWSIFNFHYCSPPTAIAENAALRRPVGMNETGFKGVYDEYYRREAWAFMMSGGALYNHLDYSFTVGKEDGSNIVREPTPGGGSKALRKQMGAMRRFLEQLDFIRMQPVADAKKILLSPADNEVYMLAEEGRQYAFYFAGTSDEIKVQLPAGNFRVLMLDPKTTWSQSITITHSGDACTLRIPPEITNETAVAFCLY
ncbi:MAG: glycoside hydrolase family 5 protein [Tannerellaceae bacterium]|jgi:endoglucanase|nr:glycoside hydrolase family 5 protein [Tannerellaceae bacterium]